MKYLIQTGVVLLGLALTACEDYLDVNTDPNNPSDASIQLVLPAAMASTASEIGGDLQNLGGFWAQVYTQSPKASQYRNIDSYNINTDLFDGNWTELYAGALNDYKRVIEKSLDQEEYNFYLIANLMQIYTYQVLVDLHDKIPFSQALDPGNIQPSYDDGQAVYTALLAQLDEAVSTYRERASATNANPRGADLFFGGDMREWLGFANSLKLKMLMRLSYTSMAKPQEVLALVNQNEFITQDAAMTQFSDVEGQRNFFYDVEVNRLGGVNQVASNSLLRFLTANNDPRTGAIYTRNNEGVFAGVEQGDFVDDPRELAQLSIPAYTPTTPAYIMTLAEVYFLQAEALIRYNAGAGAREKYEAGIEASFALHGLSGAAALYGAGGPYAFQLSGDAEADIRQVMLQKWVALANVNNIEAFFERNRTGYPAYTTLDPTDPKFEPGSLTYSINSVLPAGQAPRRLYFPDVSTSRNRNAPAQPNSIAVKVWWDKKGD